MSVLIVAGLDSSTGAGLARDLADKFGLDLPAMKAIADIWEESRDRLSDSADFNEIFKYEKSHD